MIRVIKIAIWICIAIVLVVLAKRIVGGLVATVTLVACIFISIFFIDMFTPINLRQYIGLQAYDTSVQDPKGTAKKVQDEVYGKGEGAITSINDHADELDGYYGTETEGQKEAKKAEEESKKNVEVDDNGNIVEVKGTEDSSGKESGSEKVQNNNDDKENKDEKGKSKESKKGDGDYVKYAEVEKAIRGYEGMSSKDKKIARSITPNLSMDIEGDDYRFYNNSDDKKGFYIEALGK